MDTYEENDNESSNPGTFGDMCKFVDAKNPKQWFSKFKEANPAARNPSSTYKQGRRLKDPNKLLDIKKIKEIMKSYQTNLKNRRNGIVKSKNRN